MSEFTVLGDGRVRCCGRITLTYKAEGYYFCHRCGHRYSFDGADLGVHGSGLATTEEYMMWLRARRPFPAGDGDQNQYRNPE